jgi:hypothetical protein
MNNAYKTIHKIKNGSYCFVSERRLFEMQFRDAILQVV